MTSSAATVDEYLKEIPADRRAALQAVRRAILDNLDSGYEEVMQYGMIGYVVPHRVFPGGYHVDPGQPLPFAGLAAQKNNLALYLMGLYVGPPGPDGESAETTWFKKSWARTGKRLDMGKSCIRFRRLDDLALDVVGEAIRRFPSARFVARYRAGLAARAKPGRGAAKAGGRRKRERSPGTARPKVASR